MIALHPMVTTPPPELTLRRGAIICLPPFLLMAAAQTLAYFAAGATLNFFFAGFFFLTILLPPLVLTRPWPMERLLIGGSLIDAAAVVWLVMLASSWIGGRGVFAQTTVLQWLGLYVLLGFYGLALAGGAVLLRRMRIAAVIAAAIMIVLGLAWLTWPIWLSPALTGDAGAKLGGWLIPMHPLMTANALVRHLGVWSEQPLAYHLTTLGQHVPYALPSGPWMSMAVHLALAAVLFALAVPASAMRLGRQGSEERRRMS